MTLKQEIQKRINSNLTLDENKMDGTFGQDITGGVSYELARQKEVEIDPLPNKVFALTATDDEDLNRIGDDNGVERKPAQSADVLCRVSGSKNASIDIGLQGTYQDLVFEASESAIIGDIGYADIVFVCQTEGVVVNIPQDVTLEVVGTPYGIDSILTIENGKNGVDLESNDAYKERILEKLRSRASSGNKAHYEEWAKTVVGVDDAIVLPLENGPGTVEVRISTADNTTPTQDLIDETLTYINSQAPIGASVTVKSVDYLDINVVATVTLKQGGSVSNVKELFELGLEEYLKETSETRVVSYFKMSDLLFNIDDVADVPTYTLNGAKNSISLTSLQIARKGTVTINAS